MKPLLTGLEKRAAVGDVWGWVEDDVSEACQRTERIAVFGVGGYPRCSAFQVGVMRIREILFA